MPSRADVFSFIGFSAMLICGMVFHQQSANEERGRVNMDKHRSVDTYDPVIAIEFGTTLSRVGMYMNNTFELFTDEHGRNATPSVVAYTDQGPVVGYEALELAADNPKNFIHDVKHLLGRKWTDHTTQDHIKSLDYEVVRHEKHPYSALRMPIRTQQSTKLLCPEEIAAEIILKLKRMAENRLEEKVSNVVITVPSYFNDDQRQATKDAAAIAGLETLRLVTEPNAACIGHGIDRQQFRNFHDDNDDEGLIIVYDIGTDDSEVTLESIDRGVFEKLSSAGNRHFSKFCLTAMGSTEIAVHERQILARSPLNLVEKVLKDAKVQKNRIDGIVITGEITDVAHIKPILEEYFPGKKFYDDVPADEAVIRGAVAQAGVLSGEEETSCDGQFIMDVNQLSLWIETSEGLLTKLIPRNTVIPTRKARIFSTATDNQSKAVFRIYEGERPLASQNKLLGVLEHNFIPLAPRGVPEIEVSLGIDAEWQLKAVAKEKQTGIESSININLRSHGESWYETGPYIVEAEQHHEEDMKKREMSIKSAVEGQTKFGVIVEDPERGLWY